VASPSITYPLLTIMVMNKLIHCSTAMMDCSLRRARFAHIVSVDKAEQLRENKIDGIDLIGDTCAFDIAPFEIVSLKCVPR